MPPIKSLCPPYNLDYFLAARIGEFMPDHVTGWPERALWEASFTDEAKRIAAEVEAGGRELFGWHELSREDWQRCAASANAKDLSNAPVIGIKSDGNISALGYRIWSRRV